MRRGMVVVAMIAACASAGPEQLEAPRPRPPPPVPAPPPSPSLGPAQHLAQLDVDIDLPPEARVSSSSFEPGIEWITWPRCAIRVSAGRPPVTALHVERRAGTLALTCAAYPWRENGADPETPADPHCLSVCNHVRATPGGTALERYPTEPPALEVWTHGGNAPRSNGARAWLDGTVQFYGGRCPTWRGAKGSIPPATVAALLAKLDAIDFYELPHHGVGCADNIIVDITAHTGARENTVDAGDCGQRDVKALRDELARVFAANPCAR